MMRLLWREPRYATDPGPNTQPSWAGVGYIEVGARNRRLGEPAVFGSLLAVVLADLIAIPLIGFLALFLVPGSVTGDVICQPHGTFCYHDPQHTIRVVWITLAVYEFVLAASIAASLAKRIGVLTIVCLQSVAFVVVFALSTSTLHAAERTQNQLQACSYGSSGSCPGLASADG